MNIKVAAFTVSEKSSNITVLHASTQKDFDIGLTRALTANIHMDAGEDSDPKIRHEAAHEAKCTCERLTLNVLKDSAFWLDTINLECCIIYIEGS